MVVLFLLLVLVSQSSAYVIGPNPVGCNCPQPAPICPLPPPPPPPCPPLFPLLCPPPPQCLPPPPPPPSPLPPPCPPQPLCLPCPPQPLCPLIPPFPMSCPPQPGNCLCKRKKRSTTVTTFTSENGTSDHALCNNNLIHKIILKNLNTDVKVSKEAIYSELKMKQLSHYVVLCSQSNLSFTSDSTNYCIAGNTNHRCYVFEL